MGKTTQPGKHYPVWKTLPKLGSVNRIKLSTFTPFVDKKCICLGQNFTPALKKYPWSAWLAWYIFYVWILYTGTKHALEFCTLTCLNIGVVYDVLTKAMECRCTVRDTTLLYSIFLAHLLSWLPSSGKPHFSTGKPKLTLSGIFIYLKSYKLYIFKIKE